MGTESDYQVSALYEDRDQQKRPNLFSSLFGPRSSFSQSPRSALSKLFQSSKTASFFGSTEQRRPSTSTIEAARNGNISELLVRPSTDLLQTAERVMSPIKLPEEALHGLTREEREHIFAVMAVSMRSRSQSGVSSSRTDDESRRFNNFNYYTYV